MDFIEITQLVANLIQIIVGLGAIWVAITQKEKISTAFTSILSFSLRNSLSDLSHALETLKEHTRDNNQDTRNIRKTLAYIVGKIKGNKILFGHYGNSMLKKIQNIIDDYDNDKTVLETRIIQLSAELKEMLTTLEVNNHNK